MRVLHRPDLELKKCNNCDNFFNTNKDKETFIEKYHITIPETLNEPEPKKTFRDNSKKKTKLS